MQRVDLFSEKGKKSTASSKKKKKKKREWLGLRSHFHSGGEVVGDRRKNRRGRVGCGS